MPRRLLLAPALALLLATDAAAADELTEQDRREMAWMEASGLPLGDGRPLVRVEWAKPEGGPATDEAWSPFETDGLGFLLAEDDRSWTVLGADPEGEVIPKVPKAETRARRVRVLDAATFGRDFIGPPDLEAADGTGLVRQVFEGASLGTCGEALLVARAVATRGEPALAHRVLEVARRRLRERQDDGTPTTLLAGASEECALMGIWRILLRFDDGEIPRTALRADLTAFLERFGSSSHATAARDLLRVLERMLEEDATHPRIDDAALAALPPEAQAREWVWRLRDQDGGQFMQPGSPSVFLDFDDSGALRKDTPADRLVALGHHAIPVLIETLTDERLTRTVGYWRNFHFSHYVVRFADAAHEILRTITHYEPWRHTYTAASMFKDGEAAEVQRAYRAWWEGAGAFDLPLKRLVAAAPDARAQAAHALPDRDPGRVITLATEASWGTAKVWAVLGVERERAIALSTAVLQHSKHVRLQVAAAWMLHDLGDPRGVEAMIALWTRLGADGSSDARTDPVRGEHVAAFLAACGDPRAVQALAADLGQRPAVERQLVLHAFATSGLGAVRGLSCDGRSIREPWHLTGEAADLARNLLLERLTDLASDPLRRIDRQDPIANLDPDYDAGYRLADLAVRVLAERWPDIYVKPDAPVLPASTWEELRKAFLALPRKAGSGR